MNTGHLETTHLHEEIGAAAEGRQWREEGGTTSGTAGCEKSVRLHEVTGEPDPLPQYSHTDNRDNTTLPWIFLQLINSFFIIAPYTSAPLSNVLQGCLQTFSS